jgi:hypothetical protein
MVASVFLVQIIGNSIPFVHMNATTAYAYDNFRMDTRSGRYGAAYNMVGSRCFNE